MSKKSKEPIPPSLEIQLPPPEPVINRVQLCVATEVNHQMVSSVSKDKFIITMIDSFIALKNDKIRLLIPLTNVASIHFD